MKVMRPPAFRLSCVIPEAVRVVLLYGEDAGMIRDRAETLVRAIAGSLDDPFLIVELARDQMRDLPNEAASMALTGGRRVVRDPRRDRRGGRTPSRSVLKSDAPALVVLEGGSLHEPIEAADTAGGGRRTAPPSAATRKKAALWRRRSAAPCK